MTKLAVPATTFRALLAGAATAASNDATLPVLCCVQLEWGAGQVTVRATDRYRAIIGTRDAETDGTGCVLLDGPSVKALTSALPKTVGRRDVDLQVVVEVGDAGRVTVSTPEWSRTVPLFTVGEYPNIDKLLPDESNPVATESIGFNPRFVADLAKIPLAEKMTPWRYVLFGAAKPALMTAPGPDGIAWRAMIFPVRLNGKG